MWIMWTAARIVVVVVFVFLWFWCSCRYKDRIPFDDVIFAAQRLSHFGVKERHKTERSERLWDEYIGNFTKFREIFFQIFNR